MLATLSSYLTIYILSCHDIAKKGLPSSPSNIHILIQIILTPSTLRLPRRCSGRHRDDSAPVGGPYSFIRLHFAAANSHSNVIRTLLIHGAHADRADKPGVTTEMVVRKNGKEGLADMLKEWLASKDRNSRGMLKMGPGRRGSRALRGRWTHWRTRDCTSSNQFGNEVREWGQTRESRWSHSRRE